MKLNSPKRISSVYLPKERTLPIAITAICCGVLGYWTSWHIEENLLMNHTVGILAMLPAVILLVLHMIRLDSGEPSPGSKFSTSED